MGRIARSWRMAKQSWGLLMKDKELLILPVLSGIFMLAIMASFAWGLGIFGATEAEMDALAEKPTTAIMGFAMYVLLYTAAFFFQGALVAGAMERMRGGDPTLGSALGAASKRIVPLLLWGIVAATVGMIIRAIQDRSEAVGKIVAGLLGAAWTYSTFFVVPILVMERQGIGGSFKTSAGLFKKTWGESVSANIGFGLFGFLLFLVLGAITAGLASVSPVAAIVVGCLGACTILVMMMALQAVFVASLYRYARDEQVPTGFEPQAVAQVFG